MKMNYVCYFNFYDPSQGKLVMSASSKQGLDAFEFGFWLNGDMEYTKAGDARYWIPPSQIRLIAKEEI